MWAEDTKEGVWPWLCLQFTAQLPGSTGHPSTALERWPVLMASPDVLCQHQPLVLVVRTATVHKTSVPLKCAQTRPWQAIHLRKSESSHPLAFLLSCCGTWFLGMREYLCQACMSLETFSLDYSNGLHWGQSQFGLPKTRTLKSLFLAGSTFRFPRSIYLFMHLSLSCCKCYS